MHLRSGKLTIESKVKTKGFNVKGRAADPVTTNVLFSADKNKCWLANSYSVESVYQHVSLKDAYECLVGLNKRNILWTYVLIGYGLDWLYFGRVPLPLQGPRPSAALAKADPQFPAPPGTDFIQIECCYDKPVENGDTSKSRDSVMGDSARNYAASVYGEEWAHARKWEWLHIVAHSLGGNNEVGNLVAGTFEANTQMIPHERAIRDLSQKGTVRVTYQIDLFPDSWVAIGIRMSYSALTPDGFFFQSADFSAQSDLNFDKLQYDIWSL
ncbi:hypothetical protein AAIM60_22445 [Pseudomonas lijiangensis]|uniref:hypothetical protein n=1 Tax=Pseudomonas lijiangensis TaxID=2995658 RepID=UPI0031BB6183